MGSSESSKCGVSDIGVDETKKKMILECHISCVKKLLKKGLKLPNDSLIEKTEYNNAMPYFFGFLNLKEISKIKERKEKIQRNC